VVKEARGDGGKSLRKMIKVVKRQNTIMEEELKGFYNGKR
jgi:hypothetical protein